ncbi:hypothetical protein PPERSA_03947 [Pseudocohnilembus persalinus]|uniref:Adenosine deaminase domain-containing protein n=1 Tax=Pseudocohnilembus persalinus TaxID=266149 RepID=A0A0V0QAI7_PSEPJ|nr:hypothetical protein PPERSA_03947 [Pseudocohnilembus persalinus]|eukprot:KRW99241.1 hypothetical protein PPERSA_03947 [Pseudocohnilembus persalinus]
MSLQQFQIIKPKQITLQQFIQNMPKIELHSHLSGAIRRETLKKLLEKKNISYDNSIFEKNDMLESYKIFDYIYQGLQTLDDIKQVTEEILHDNQEQNVVYLELRSTPKQTQQFTQQDYLNTIFQVMYDFEQNEQNFLKPRFILSIDRTKSIEEAYKRVDLYQQFKRDIKFSKYLVGLDFCGDPQVNDFKNFKEVFQKAKDQNIKITLHGSEQKNNENETQYIIDFKPDRIGHFLVYNNKQFEQVIKNRIPIEMCPTSNLYAQQLKSYDQHHFINFFQNKHPISLNTDDFCCFNSNITQEFMQIALTFKLQKQDIYKIMHDTIQMIFDNQNQNELQQITDKYFQNFEFI